MDSKKDIYVIHWGDLNMDAYLYGSSLTLKDYKIIFENPMMPPEVAIKKWHMMTSYQRDRNEPLLPVLEKGKTEDVVVGEYRPCKFISFYRRIVIFHCSFDFLNLRYEERREWELLFRND